MSDAKRDEPEPVSLALGRIPSGLFILTTRAADGGRPTGLLASWVQQAGFDPPMVSVAIRRDRFVGDWLAASGRFVLNQLATGQKPLLKHFARGFGPDDDAFHGLEIRDDVPEGPVLPEALGFLRCAWAGEVVGGDHRIVLGRVEGGGLLHPGREPMIHVRHSGSHY